MTETKGPKNYPRPPLGRLIIGTIIFVSGFLSPALIPWVLSTDLGDGLKAVLSGLLAFGIPEIFMLIAAGVMGKQGFNYIMGALGRFLKPMAPPDEVSKTRYKIGLFMFFIPVAFGFLAPYLGVHLPIPEEYELYFYIGGDVLIFLSLFVLGGHFWDKLRSLFVHGAKAVFPVKLDSDTKA
jgi:hypothetical protein